MEREICDAANRARERLVRLANKLGVSLRQSYRRVGKLALIKHQRYAHAHQFKRANKSLRKLKTYHSLPLLYPYRYFTAAGGLISYGPDLVDQYRLAASYVDRILKGEKPADLPVQFPTRYMLVINLKTAKALLSLAFAHVGMARAGPYHQEVEARACPLRQLQKITMGGMGCFRICRSSNVRRFRPRKM
jgi:ABC transporter substrate binding protein